MYTPTIKFPLLCFRGYAKTVDTKGIREVYDATANGRDLKRFCSLNLFAPLQRTADGFNVPPPHIIFKAFGFKTMDDWDPLEMKEYHPGVYVSFQGKGWLDVQAHMLGLKQCMGPQNAQLEDSGEKGVTLEDNLSSHNTCEVLTFWTQELSNFSLPEFIPPGMAEPIQAIDRHIGIQYKEYTYLCIRKELTKRLRAARDANGGADGVTVSPLTPRKKRIIITHAIGEFHVKITK